jgi:hypothetical protein
MRVIEPGHVYELLDAPGPGLHRARGVQVLRFTRRRDDRGELLPLAQYRSGILTQELLRVAIDRTLYLYAEAPCDEDTAIIQHLRAALVLYESRASRRALEKLSRPELAERCPECDHILCLHRTPG